MNKCVFIGNLTRDPESSTTGSGVNFCRFSIAVNRTYANANGEREADFINVVTWRGLAENCGKYLAKGRKVCVAGQLQTRTYDDKDGNRRSTFEIVADDVEFLPSRNDGAEGGGEAPAPAPRREQPRQNRTNPRNLEPIESDDELPF